MEIENNSKIAFLDTSVYREPDGRLTTSVYRKPTHTDQYILYTGSTTHVDDTSDFVSPDDFDGVEVILEQL